MEVSRARLTSNLARVRDQIARACDRSQRDPACVRLVAVTKSVGVETIRELLALGLADFGESQVQQITRRTDQLGCDLSSLFDRNSAHETHSKPRWHMIGHLQRNKVRALLPACRLIHSVDSLRLAQEISTRAAAPVDVLIEINVAGEAQKAGLSPVAVPAAITEIAQLPQLQIRGLMTMAPLDPDPEYARPHFAALRRLRDALLADQCLSASAVELSMGMSQDYVVAIEEGATFVRVGSALFES